MSLRRILLIFDDCGPGDAAGSAFLLEAVRHAHPEAEIVVLAGEQAAEVFHRSTIPDRVVVSRLYLSFHRGTLRARFEKVREIASLLKKLGRGYDLAITFFWGTLALSVLALLVARRQIGYRRGFARLRSIDLGRYDQFRDSVRQNLDVLAAAGIEPPHPALHPLRTDSSDAAPVEALRLQHGIDPERPVVVLHSGSDWACQQWSIDSWAALADALIAEHDVQVVWTGREAERGYVAAVQGLMRSRSVSLCGQTSNLGELSALVARADLCISVDSVPWELALAQGTSVIILSGPTMPSEQLIGGTTAVALNRTRPDVRRMILRCQASFPHGTCHDYSCPLSQMRHIKLDDVLRQVASLGPFRPASLEAASR